jgi:hypothetical protein
VQQLKQGVTTRKMLPVLECVNIPFHTQFIDDSGRVRPNDVMQNAADSMLDEPVRTENALHPRRPAIPAAALPARFCLPPVSARSHTLHWPHLTCAQRTPQPPHSFAESDTVT